MKIFEVFGYDTADERDQEIARVQKILANTSARNTFRPQAPANTDYQQKKGQVEKAVGAIAASVSGDQFEQFKSQALQQFPDAEKYVNLPWVFDFYNPQRREQSAQSWNEYGKARQAKDPSVMGLGPTGQRNYTGD